MSSPYPDNNRQAMPRCIDYATSVSLGLLRALRQQRTESGHPDSGALDEWLSNPTIFTAVELLSQAMIVKDFESEQAINAAQFILRNAPLSSGFIRELADGFLGEEIPSKHTTSIDLAQPTPVAVFSGRRIASLKRAVRLYPRNPIAWSELSLCYETLGQTDKSRAAMQAALQIGGPNRFILRSAACCFAHMREPDRSVWVLNKSGLCALDPWIASAEIAICESAGLTSRCVSKGKQLLNDDRFTDFSRSELAVGIGTIHLGHGDIRHARKLVKQALRDPTENALAQAEWMATGLGTKIHEVTDIRHLQNIVPASYEAQALRSFSDGDYAGALKSSERWSRFQQLSSRPIIFASFIASVYLEDDSKAIEMMTESTPAQRDSFTVTNNLVCSFVNKGEVQAGVDLLNTIDVDALYKRDKLVLQATTGLVHFRVGEDEKGRKLYRAAIDGFSRLNDPFSAALAAYFLAREEQRVGSDVAASTTGEARARIAKLNLPPLDFLAKKLSAADPRSGITSAT